MIVVKINNEEEYNEVLDILATKNIRSLDKATRGDRWRSLYTTKNMSKDFVILLQIYLADSYQKKNQGYKLQVHNQESFLSKIEIWEYYDAPLYILDYELDKLETKLLGNK